MVAIFVNLSRHAPPILCTDDGTWGLSLLVNQSTSELHTKLGRAVLAFQTESNLDIENTVTHTVETIVSCIMKHNSLFLLFQTIK